MSADHLRRYNIIRLIIDYHWTYDAARDFVDNEALGFHDLLVVMDAMKKAAPKAKR